MWHSTQPEQFSSFCFISRISIHVSCLNPNGLGLWYADHSNSKCVRDCEEGNGVTRGGLANGDRNYSDPKSCCESELQWRLPKFCEVSHQEVVEKCIDSTMTC
jgi:hypothetical protein